MLASILPTLLLATVQHSAVTAQGLVKLPAPPLEVRVLDVKRALAVLVVGPDGTSVLFDGGYAYTAGSEVPLSLAAAGVTGLDHTFASHWHGDHYEGLRVLFENGWLPSAAAWDRGDWNAPSFPGIAAYVASAGSLRQQAYLGQIVDLGYGATLEIVAINGETICGDYGLTVSEPGFENCASLAAVVRYDDFALYIGGDLPAGGGGTSNVEGLLANCLGQVDVVVASHHGGVSGENPALVAALDPSFVVFSCGELAGTQFPAPAVIEAWNNEDAARVLWATRAGDPAVGTTGFADAGGNIVIRTDGESFTTSRTAGPEVLRFAVSEAPQGDSTGVRISEVHADPQAVDEDQGQWVELAQTAYGTADLRGLEVESDGSFVIGSRILLDVDERLLVAIDGGPAVNGGVFPGLVAPREDFELEDDAGELLLFDSGGAKLDHLIWGGLGVPVVEGASLERMDLRAAAVPSNFSPATTAWGGGDLGSPWSPNSNDATAWPAELVFDGPLSPTGKPGLRLDSYADAGEWGIVLISTAPLSPGFSLLGFTVDLVPGPVLVQLAILPQSLLALDTMGSGTMPLDVLPLASLGGVTLYANALTFSLVGGTLPVGSRQSKHIAGTIPP